MLSQRPVATAFTAAILLAGAAAAQGRAPRLANAPAITDIRYAVTFTALTAIERTLGVSMTFTAAGPGPVLLALPVWTPGAYEVARYARNVSGFAATGRGAPLRWDKIDPDTWRVFTEGPGEVSVSFRYRADTLDNAGSWARDDFVMFNGTNLFLYPAGSDLAFPATVSVTTEASWRVATGLVDAGPGTFSAPSYHELVDHPFFVGRFDLDSAMVGGTWFRLSSYPSGSMSGVRKTRLFDQLARAVPRQIEVFRDLPWKRYELMQVADSAYGGMSALEHENSNLAVVGTEVLDEDFVPLVYAHEIFHAFNVKRLRPADLFPYRYDAMQPTTWLWMSEGITDYYADLSLVRGGVTTEAGFLAATQRKIEHVHQTAPTALEDASLQAWLGMRDGTSDLYYDKGSLAGLALDILIRDASDNAGSLDDVMRELYSSTYRNGRGFTHDEWWNAVSRAARGANFSDFRARYVDGRAVYPWPEWLAKAGWRIHSDTTREPRLGLSLLADSAGLRVAFVDPSGAGAAAGVREGDLLLSVAGVVTADPRWQGWRQRYAGREGAEFPIGLRRDGRPVTVTARVRLAVLIDERLDVDPDVDARAMRIRDGILNGEAVRRP